MAEPDWNPDTGGRSLAEILREAGIESANRAAAAAAGTTPTRPGSASDGQRPRRRAGRPGYGRRRSDRPRASPRTSRRSPGRPRPARERAAPRLRDERGRSPTLPPRAAARRARRAPTAAIPGLRPDRKPGVPAGGAMPAAGPRRRRPSTAPRPAPEPAAAAPVRAGARRGAPRRRPSAGPRRSAVAARRRRGRLPVGPIPVGPEDADDLDATPQESALAWLRFAGELVIALAAGIGIYFAATLLWENVPYLAVLLVPMAVTGLVAGVGAWRQRQGREPVGPRLLAILVFAGTLLTVAPAAGLLAAS